jgi:hypothetical protein
MDKTNDKAVSAASVAYFLGSDGGVASRTPPRDTKDPREIPKNVKWIELPIPAIASISVPDI